MVAFTDYKVVTVDVKEKMQISNWFSVRVWRLQKGIHRGAEKNAFETLLCIFMLYVLLCQNGDVQSQTHEAKGQMQTVPLSLSLEQHDNPRNSMPTEVETVFLKYK